VPRPAELDALIALKAKAEKALLAEARRHREWRLLKTCPGLVPIRTAELLPAVVTPCRLQSRSHFWVYCELGIVMRSSSDWVRTQTGQWVKAAVRQTRGLNRNFNHTLKRIFKGAHHRASDRRDRAGAVAHGRSIGGHPRAVAGGEVTTDPLPGPAGTRGPIMAPGRRSCRQRGPPSMRRPTRFMNR
jgi:hypothetical protein